MRLDVKTRPATNSMACSRPLTPRSPSSPKSTNLLVADRADVVNGEFDLMGGSWDRIQPLKFPHWMMLGIALGVGCPVHPYRGSAQGQRAGPPRRD
jgi:hypothetical protein